MDFLSPLELSVVLAVLVAAALSRVYAPLRLELVDRWTRARGVDLTAESWPVAGAYLRRARILRAWGAIAGLVAPSVLRPLLGEPWQVAGVGAHAVGPASWDWCSRATSPVRCAPS